MRAREIPKPGGWLSLALAMIAAISSPSMGASSCDACHSAPSLGKSRVTQQTLLGSAHTAFGCLDCHAGAPDKPVAHKVPLPRVDCGRCHSMSPSHGAKPVGQVKHGESGKAAELKPACADCHGTHQILPSATPGSKVSRQNVVQTCAVCHGPRGKAAKTLGDRQVIEYRQSVHGQPDPARPGLYAAVCTDCHGSHDILPASDAASPVNKQRVPSTCGKCHPDELGDYRASIHGTALAKGVKEAPSCTDCHGEHRILRPSDEQSTVSGGHVVETCSNCHANMDLIKRAGLPTASVSGYRKSFHGVANRMGELQVANCASCHSHHLILPQSDPRSTVNAANIPATCGAPGCHPGAGPNFAKGNMHLQPTPGSDRPVYWVTLLYIFFIWVMMLGFIALIAADLVQHRRRKYSSFAPDPSQPLDKAHVQRFSISQIRQHWVLIAAFLMLIITGLPIKYADWPISEWLIRLQGGVTFRGVLHRIMALGLIGVCIWHLVWTISTRQGREDFRKMLPEPKDIGRAFGQLKYYLGLSMEMPGFGRFNLIEKFEYLAMGWGSVVMIVTGLVLWFPEIALRFIPKWALDICQVIHSYEALLAFLAITIWHFYHVHLKPGMFPMSRTWLDGRVELAEMRHEHRGEYERLIAEMQPEAPAPPPEPAPDPEPTGEPSADEEPEDQ